MLELPLVRGQLQRVVETGQSAVDVALWEGEEPGNRKQEVALETSVRLCLNFKCRRSEDLVTTR